MAQNDALNRLNSMMNATRSPRMDVPRYSNDDFTSHFANGYNMMGTIMDGIRARNDRNRLQKLLKGVYGDGEGQLELQAQPQQLQEKQVFSLGDTQQPSLQQGDRVFSIGNAPEDNSFGSVFGQATATPVVNQKSQPDYSMLNFMRSAINSGMLPSNAMAAYSAYLAPIEQDVRQRNVRDAMKVLARRNLGLGLSDEDYYDAMAKLNYNLGEDYALKDNNSIIDQMSKVLSGLLSPIGAMHDPEKYRKIGYPINLNMWDQLANTIDINQGNYSNSFSGNFGNNNLSSGDTEYGGNNENARAIYTYLKGKGLPDNVIAGIMGNIEHESGFNHDAFNPNDNNDGPSGGIAQWHAGRFDNLKNFAQQRGKDWKDLQTQLDFMVDEINSGYPDLLQRMANLSPNEAALLYHKVYERSDDTPEVAAGRGTKAMNIYNNRRSIGNGEGNTWYKKSDGVDISGLQPQTKAGLETAGSIFKNMFGEQLMVTSGKDSNAHAQGQYSHYNGYKLDVSSPVGSLRLENPQERASFINALENAGIKVIDEWAKDKHLDLDFSGYKGGNIGNTGGGYSYQPQQRPSFASAFNPQIVSGLGAILNPMALYKATVEQAERQRLQNNADRQFNYQVFNSERNYAHDMERLREQQRHNRAMEDIRSGNGTGTKNSKIKPISSQEYASIIKEYSNTPEVDENGKSAISQDLINNVGLAWAPEFLKIYQDKNGNLEDTVKEFYKKKHYDGDKGYTLSHKKLVAGISSALAAISDSSNNENILKQQNAISKILDGYAKELGTIAEENGGYFPKKITYWDDMFEEDENGNIVKDSNGNPILIEPLGSRNDFNTERDIEVGIIEDKIKKRDQYIRKHGGYVSVPTHFGNKTENENARTHNEQLRKEANESVGLTEEQEKFYYNNRASTNQRQNEEINYYENKKNENQFD